MANEATLYVREYFALRFYFVVHCSKALKACSNTCFVLCDGDSRPYNVGVTTIFCACEVE